MESVLASAPPAHFLMVLSHSPPSPCVSLHFIHCWFPVAFHESHGIAKHILCYSTISCSSSPAQLSHRTILCSFYQCYPPQLLPIRCSLLAFPPSFQSYQGRIVGFWQPSNHCLWLKTIEPFFKSHQAEIMENIVEFVFKKI